MPDWIHFSPRTKSVLLLVATLAIGVVLGAVSNAWLAQQRFERIREMRQSGGFERMLIETIQPTSDDQRVRIDSVVGRSAQRMRSLRRSHRHDVRRVVDSMRTALAPILTDEQMDRLDRRLRVGRRRFSPPPSDSNRRPGPRRPPEDRAPPGS